MGFSKNFPKTMEGSNYPKWIEVSLTDEEEKEQEELARKDNIRIMAECVNDAKGVFSGNGLKDYQTDVVNMAIALFGKRAAYSVHWKENKCKEKFDKEHK